MNKNKLPTLQQLAAMYPGELSTLAIEFINLIGIDSTVSTFKHFGGNSIYFTSLRCIFRRCIKRYYHENKGNVTIDELARHYNYTLRQIQNIVYG